MTEKQPGLLYIVATPLGNLGDISARALTTFQAVDYIAAEDTRHSSKLLSHFNITTPLIAYHDHSDQRRLQKLLDYLLDGKSIALISDAGTPLISDPGYQLVKHARGHEIKVVPVPGACALIAALSVSGMPSDRFIFEGFLPAKPGARQSYLKSLSNEVRTLIFYESTHRLLDSLYDMKESFGAGREIAIARELTKTYETVLTGELSSVIALVEEDANQQRGEFVVLVKGYEKSSASEHLSDDVVAIMTVLLEELSVKQAAVIGAKITGIKKRMLYQWAVEQQRGQSL